MGTSVSAAKTASTSTSVDAIITVVSPSRLKNPAETVFQNLSTIYGSLGLNGDWKVSVLVLRSETNASPSVWSYQLTFKAVTGDAALAASFTGEKGPKGDKGDPGRQGERGPQGLSGSGGSGSSISGSGVWHNSGGSLDSSASVGTPNQILGTNPTGTDTIWITVGGDTSLGTGGSFTVSKIHGASVPAAGSIVTGNSLYASGSSSLIYSSLNLAGGPGWVSGLLPIGNQAAPTGTGFVRSISGVYSTTASKLEAGDVNGPATDTYVVSLVGGIPTWAAPATAGVPTSRHVDSGFGLIGGGDLTVNRTISADATVLATRAYAESLAFGLSSKAPARFATTGGLPTYTYNNGVSGVGATITITANGVFPTTDGITPQAGDVVLVKDESGPNAPYNGHYHITTLGTVLTQAVLTRTPGSDTSSDLAGAVIPVLQGTLNGGKTWLFATDPDTFSIGVSAVNFTPQLGGTSVSGTGLWHSASGVLDPSASLGTSNQLIGTNNAGTDTVWFTVSGDISLASGSFTVEKVNGASIQAAGSLVTGNAAYVSGTSALTYSALNLAGGSGWVTGVLPLGNVGAPTGTGIPHIISGTVQASASPIVVADMSSDTAPANYVPISDGAGGVSWHSVPAVIGQTGKVYYLDPSTASDIGGSYKVASISPSANPETTLVNAAIGTLSYTLMGEFATTAGEPGITSFPTGIASRLCHAITGGSNQIGRLRMEIWKRAIGGTETLVRSDDSQDFSGTAIQEVSWTAVYSVASALFTTDRLIFRLYSARVSGAGTCNITVYFDGTTNISYVQTTIPNQVSPTGTGLVHVASGTIDTAASLGTSNQLIGTNNAGTDTVWFTAAGDVTLASGSFTVAKVHGATVPAAGALTTGNAAYVSGVSALTYSALNLAGGSGWVTGTLPLGNVGAPTGTGLAKVTSGSWDAASSQLAVGDVAGTTTNGYGIVIVAGVPTWTSLATVSTLRWPDEKTYTLVSGNQVSQQTSVQVVGGGPFDPSKIQATGVGVTRSIVFAAQFYCTTGTAEVTLYDVDDNVVIATLTTTSTSVDEKEQALTVGSVATNVIPNSRKKYEVRARFSTGSPSQIDQVIVEWAGFIVTYTLG